MVKLGDKLVCVNVARNGSFWNSCENAEWEMDTFAVFRQFIKKHNSYIDLGAWIGPTLLYGCQLARKAYGVEPDPIAYVELVENVASNAFTDNVTLVNACIAPVSNKTVFGSCGDGGDSNSSLLFATERTRWTVEGLTFDDLIQRYGIHDCGFIKIDIEGGEYIVLPTMTTYLRKQRPTVHLSLHPLFLTMMGRYRDLGMLVRAAIRLKKTIELMWCLRFYRKFYDPHIVLRHTRTVRGRIRFHLDEVSRWPLAFLRSCLYAILGRQTALVLTDLDWRTDELLPNDPDCGVVR